MKLFAKSLAVIVLLSLFACEKTDISDYNNSDNPTLDGDQNGSNQDTSSPIIDVEDTFSSVFQETTESSDLEDDDKVENSAFSTQINIVFNGSSVTHDNKNSDIEITTSNGHIVVNSSSKEVEYVLSGKSTNGSFKIYSSNKFKVTLSDVELNNPSGPAINIQSKKRNFIVLADNSVNTLSDGTSYTSYEDEDMKGTFFSEGQNIFSGSGTLNVTGNYKHAICSDDYIIFRPGNTFNIKAASDGVHTNEKILFFGSQFNVESVDEAFESEEIGISVYNASITATTSGSKGHGLKTDADLNIYGGVINISTEGSASKAMLAKGDISITGGYINLKTTGNGLYDSSDADISSAACVKGEGKLTFSNATLYAKSTGSAGKGINITDVITINSGKLVVETTGKQYTYSRLSSSAKGIKSKDNVTINNGYINVSTMGGEGSEGIESKNILTINNGSVIVNSYDDGLNASKSIVINGGNTYCYSSNNDGVDSNGTLTVTGGLIIAAGATSPEDGFDCDQNTFKITGGTLIGVGGSTSTPTSSACTQRSVVYKGSSFTSGEYLVVHTADNESLMIYQLPRTYSSMTLLYSSPLLESNKTYYISSNATVSDGESWYGYYTGGTYTNATNKTSFTTSSMVTSIGTSGSGGGGGNWRP